jgi:hypothetical protein
MGTDLIAILLTTIVLLLMVRNFRVRDKWGANKEDN